MFIVTGPVFPPDGSPIEVMDSGICVPVGFYKAVLVESFPLRMAGYFVPNESSSYKPSRFAVSVDEVERLTGLDFFHALDYDVQTNLESRVNAL